MNVKDGHTWDCVYHLEHDDCTCIAEAYHAGFRSYWRNGANCPYEENSELAYVWHMGRMYNEISEDN